jgi:BirA family transcriptional regulator, biotin operon repressor / biotin---[acetyl-CoA-carboxylase] ligase
MNRLTFQTLHYDSLPSTNTELAKLAARGAAEGLSVMAEEQTAGRGRLQRSWSSPKGAGLYFSILLRPELPLYLWPLITFMAALAVGDALQKALDLQTEIKWPNDLLAGERKICGILSETTDTPTGRAVIVGIGINLTRQAYPSDLQNWATSVEEETGRVPVKEAVIKSLQDAVARWYGVLQEDGGDKTVLQTWTGRSPYAEGKLIDVVNGEETFRGVTRGLEADGALRVETESGGMRIVRAGDVVSVRSSKLN